MREVENNLSKTVSSGNGETSQYTMATTGWMFRTVMGGLYSNKVESVIREIVSNGIDANIMAKNAVDPVKVILPSHFRHEFSVRDYGDGMPHDFVMKLYSTVGHSEKRGTNIATGMFGLGSKSPFAICDGFTVTTYIDGVQRVYSTYYDQTDIPVIELKSESKTTEKNGVKVTVPVRREDTAKFEDALRKLVFAYYDKNVEFSRHFTNDSVGPMEIVKRSVNEFVPGMFQLIPPKREAGYNPWNGSCFIRQGTALYPLETEKLGIVEYGSEYARCLKMLQRHNSVILFDMPIGTFDVTPNREQISYNNKSIANIAKIVSDALDAAIEKLSTAIGNATTVREAFANVLASYPEDVRNRPSAWETASEIVAFANNVKPLDGSMRLNFDARRTFTSPAARDLNKTPPMVATCFNGRVQMGYNDIPNGYAGKTEHTEFTRPAVAFVLPSSVRHWEDRVVKFMAESAGFDLLQGDALHFLVVRVKNADVAEAAKRLEALDFFEKVFSDDKLLPEITKEMEASAPLPRPKHGRDDVYVWKNGEWSDNKVKVDFSVPAYYFVRQGTSARVIIKSAADRATFKAAEHWKGTTVDANWNGLDVYETIWTQEIQVLVNNARHLDILKPDMPIYRLTEAQAERLTKLDHALESLPDTVITAVLGMQEVYAYRAQWSSFSGGSAHGLVNKVADELVHVLTGYRTDGDTVELAKLLLSDDTFAMRLAGQLHQGYHSTLARHVKFEQDMSRSNYLRACMKQLMPLPPTMKSSIAFPEDDSAFDRFPFLDNTYDLDRVNKRHAKVYIEAVMTDPECEGFKLADYPAFAPLVNAIRAAIKDTEKEVSLAA